MGCYIGNNCGGELGVIIATILLFFIAKGILKALNSPTGQASTESNPKKKKDFKENLISKLEDTFNYQLLANTLFGFMMDILLSSYLSIYVGT